MSSQELTDLKSRHRATLTELAARLDIAFAARDAAATEATALQRQLEEQQEKTVAALALSAAGGASPQAGSPDASVAAPAEAAGEGVLDATFTMSEDAVSEYMANLVAFNSKRSVIRTSIKFTPKAQGGAQDGVINQ